MMILYLRLYGVLALGHIALQMVLGHLHYLIRKPRERKGAADQSVTVVVPVFNEIPDQLAACLESIRVQHHHDVQVIVVDDGSPNLAELEPVYLRYLDPGWTVMRLSENVGKRAAQCVAFEAATGDIILTVDSDTVLATPDTLQTLLRSFNSRRVGAVTGLVGALNAKTNLLTRLTAMRYWIAFNQERAAQSLFGVVLCCSGPFSAYRRSVIEEVKADYAAQTFLGQRCTFGDDRHLTNLVLARGYRTLMSPSAEALTHVPENFADFIRQQVRWNKSFYRELLWTARFAHRRHGYMALDLALQTILPFMLLGALFTIAIRSASSPEVLATYGLIVLVIALLRSSYGAVRTRSAAFLLFAVYGFLHVLALLPARMYAVCTMGRNHWGTRGMTKTTANAVEDVHVEMLRPREPIALPQQRSATPHQSTVMIADDTRELDVLSTMPMGDILPTFVRTRLGRDKPVRFPAPAITLPRQRTPSHDDRETSWAPANA